MVDVYVAAGSNVEPGRRLRQALALLGEQFGQVDVSPAYRNPAVGFNGHDFVNLAVRFTTSMDVGAVVDRLRRVEEACGRPREAPKWAPRAMDLDLVLYGDTVADAPGLTLPRPDLVRRSYMLRPMADLAPDLLHPVLGSRLADLWAAFGDEKHPLVRVDLAEVE